MIKSQLYYVLKTEIHEPVQTTVYQGPDGPTTSLAFAVRFETVIEAMGYRTAREVCSGRDFADSVMIPVAHEFWRDVEIDEWVETLDKTDCNEGGYFSAPYSHASAVLYKAAYEARINPAVVSEAIKEAMIYALAMLSYDRDKGLTDFKYGDWREYLTNEPEWEALCKTEKPVSAIKPDFIQESRDEWAVYKADDGGKFITERGEWIDTPTFHPLWRAKEFAESEFWFQAEILSPEDTAIVMAEKTSSKTWLSLPDSRPNNPIRWSAGNA